MLQLWEHSQFLRRFKGSVTHAIQLWEAGDAQTFPMRSSRRWSCPLLPPAVVAHVELAATLGAQGCMLAVRPLLLGAPLLGDAEVAVAACMPAAIYT